MAKVLLIDRHAPESAVLRRELIQRGFEVKTAANLYTAREMFFLKHPDIIVAHLESSRPRPAAVIAAMRREFPGTPALLISEEAPADEGELVTAADPSYYWTPPTEPDTLARLCEALLVAAPLFA